MSPECSRSAGEKYNFTHRFDSQRMKCFLCIEPRSHAKLLTAARKQRGSLLVQPAPRARSRAARAAGGGEHTASTT